LLRVKIAYLINQYPQASQSFIRREIAALEGLGFQVERFTLRTWDQEVVDPGDKAEKARTRVVLGVGAFGLLKAMLAVLFTRPGAFVRTLRLALKMGKRGDRGRLYHLIYLGEACVLLGWFKACGARHVHAHFGTNSTTVAMLARALGGPTYSFTCHGPEEFDRPEALKLREKIARASFVVAVSEYGRSQLFRWCDHEDWEKIHVVHCGVDSSFLAADPPELSDTPQVVCVGRLAEQKGQLLLVRAAAQLHEQGVPFRLVLVGDGPMRNTIEAVIRRNRLEDHVVITGWMSNDQVREQILASRAMVLPSFAEGLPVVIMEALALKRPVASTYVAGIPELVESGNCGYLVPPGSVTELASVLRRVLTEDVSILRQMGSAGRRRVLERHDACIEARKLSDLFRSIAQEEDAAINTTAMTTSERASVSGVGPTEVKLG
jgi:glycosyltransferase involved in cell wall biosynthesis